MSGVLDLVTITSLLLDGMGGWLGAGEGKRGPGGQRRGLAEPSTAQCLVTGSNQRGAGGGTLKSHQ